MAKLRLETCIAIGLGLAGGALVFFLYQVHQTQIACTAHTVHANDSYQGVTEMTFPAVSGRNLEGRRFNLPSDFEGEYNVVMVAFFQEHQYLVYTWVPFLAELSRAYPTLRVYELPTLRRYSPIERMMINGWMRGGIPDPATRAATITLYIDTQKFINTLGLPDNSTIYTLLVDREGRVYWHIDGDFTPEKGQDLKNTLADLYAG